MKLTTLKYGSIQNIALKLDIVDAGLLENLAIKDICRVFEKSGIRYLKNERTGKSMPIKGDDLRSANLLRMVVRNHNRSVFWITNKSEPNKIQIQRHTFNNVVNLETDCMEIALTDKIWEDIKKRFLGHRQHKQEIFSWLESQLLLDLGEDQAIVISSGEREFDGKAFRIHGEEICIDIIRHSDNQFVISRILRSHNEKMACYLLKNKINFCDKTTVGKLQEGLADELFQIVSSGQSYIKLWEEYNRIEIEQSIKATKKAGTICYEGWEYEEGKNSIAFNIISENFGKWTKEEIQESSLAFDEKLPLFFEEDNHDKLPEEQFIGKLDAFDTVENKLYVKYEEENTTIPQKGHIWLSLLGDKVSTDRRKKAANRIKTGEVPMPQLSLILEDKKVASTNYRQLKPITAKVIESFGCRPNPKQEIAMEIALNTPDIAVIQGPPGTGKTQVIKALCTRLIEEANRNGENINETILLAAFQHDAVSNMAERVRIMGLPVTKVKLKDGHDPIDKWRKETVHELSETTGEMPELPIASYRKAIAKIDLEFRKDENFPIEKINDYLDGIYTEHKKLFSISLQEEYLKLQVIPKEAPIPTKLKLLRKAINELRINSDRFEIDGDIKVMKLQICLKKNGLSLNIQDANLLDEILENRTLTTSDFAKLVALQTKLTLQFFPPQKTLKANRGKISEILSETINELKALEIKTGSIKSVLEEYRDDLQNNKNWVKESLRNYQAALAATVQGADSGNLYALLDDNHDAFESVIVDEAARANPLDLFIALTRGSRRIILVGDHRQLPHMLEPDVEKELTDAGEGTEAFYKEALQKSLFERLIAHLKVQGNDRSIMLDTQYRMHPVIGDFISRVFYERFGDSPIKSGVTWAQRQHNFSIFERKPLAWIDLPHSRGAEQRDGSTSRPVEAKLIMEYLEKMSKEEAKMSFGIISFYAAQVKELQKAGLEYGFTHEKDGKISIHKDYKSFEDEKGETIERLRIGTVDSFQGKEFDVVILSMTRSNKKLGGLAKYGFLTFENRLNVAMSRAKRLLIVVGDAKMVTGKSAEKSVPGLFEFYKLTGKDGIRL